MSRVEDVAARSLTNRGAWRDRPNRWLVSLQWSGEPL